jgi:large subunit ribosomal protein L29
MKTKELKDKSKGELEKLLSDKQEATRRLRFDTATKQVKNTREVRNNKRDIARIITLIKENNGK